MHDIAALLEALSPAQRESLTAKLLEDLTKPLPAPAPAAAVATADEPTPSSYYDMTDAVSITFKAKLSVNEKSRNKSYAERFDHVWCKGHTRVKGPKGGVYFVGRCVMGVKKGQQVKGILRVGNKHFDAFQAGTPLDAWFRPDGEAEAILIGTLTELQTL